MTNNESNTDYSAQVAELIQEAFQSLGNAIALPAGTSREDRAKHAEQAHLKMEAAQAIATLANAREARIQALIQIAALDSVAGEAPDKSIAQDAYAVAAVMLGLVEDAPREMDLEALRALLDEDRKKDDELGDLL